MNRRSSRIRSRLADRIRAGAGAGTSLVIRLRPAARPRQVPNARVHAQRFLIAFGLLIATGSLLLALPVATVDGGATPPVDALFTAVSATCVTGLVTVDTADHWNGFGEGVILVLMQGGGLSFTVGASIVLQMLRRGASLRDALLLRDGEPALSVREAVELSRHILRFTLTVEAIGAAALMFNFWLRHDMPFGWALWRGVFLAVSAFSNASFDLSGGFRSLQSYQTDVWVNLVVALLIQSGALSYLVLHDIAERRRWSRLTLDAKLVLLIHGLLVLGSAIFFLAVEWGHSLASTPTWAKPMAALFESVAARSGGFSTVDFSQVSPATLFVFVGIMLVGGAPGGTAGGVRLTTIGVVAVAVLTSLRGQEESQVFGWRIPIAIVFRALTVIVLFMLVHFAATLTLTLTENALGGKDIPFIALMFEAMSALATDGLSTGITPSLTVAGKLVLCAAMFIGRVGPLTAVYALQQRQQGRTPYRFPEAPVRIG